ncbi:MAG TPA: family 10 glycosylhydrolase, partial [Verrucomicrobiae bacterium]|nr:family 10 glycosylhydrolase [Verrucomicrobiae bacterium]
MKPPKPNREFRAAWVATVGNIDWPSKPGLSTSEQKAELVAIMDRAAALHLNAIIFQVRPACDALYASKIEPWSEYLTGTMGKAPQPFYDPLAFAIEQAHKRGLALHAWFNPYRAIHPSAKSAPSANHISRTHPELVRHYGKQVWLDPGEKAVQDYSLSVILDVVHRY